jgi:hypothetical protein
MIAHIFSMLLAQGGHTKPTACLSEEKEILTLTMPKMKNMPFWKKYVKIAERKRDVFYSGINLLRKKTSKNKEAFKGDCPRELVARKTEDPKAGLSREVIKGSSIYSHPGGDKKQKHNITYTVARRRTVCEVPNQANEEETFGLFYLGCDLW